MLVPVVKDRQNMSSLDAVLQQNSWPIGFANVIVKSKDVVGMRFVIVDNSRSMLKRDGHRLLNDRHGNIK